MDMEICAMYARAFGLYLTISSIAVFTNYKMIDHALDRIINKDPMMIVAGMFTLFIGAFLVANHNVWVANWTVLITIICWLTLLKGALLTLTSSFANFAQLLRNNTQVRYILNIIFLVIGVFLLYKGYSYR